MSAKPYNELPLSETPLSMEERVRWVSVLDPLLKYAGSPGDWGYGSKLGVLTRHLYQLRTEIMSEPARQEETAS